MAVSVGHVAVSVEHVVQQVHKLHMRTQLEYSDGYPMHQCVSIASVGLVQTKAHQVAQCTPGLN